MIVAELSIAGLAAGALPVVEAVQLPHVQPIERDLTVDIPDTVPAGQVARTIRQTGGSILEAATLTGMYRGQPLDPNERSLTFRLRFGAPDRAITDAEVDAGIGTITDALADHLGGRIRS